MSQTEVPFSIFVPGALDLIRSRGDAPGEISRKVHLVKLMVES